MKTDNGILSLFYQKINVSGVTSKIDGKIYKGEKPLNSQKQDIVINILTNDSIANNILQSGVVNINCFCVQDTYTVRNYAKLDEIITAVITALSLTNGSGGSGQLSYELKSQKAMRDFDDPKMFFSNLRLDFTYKN